MVMVSPVAGLCSCRVARLLIVNDPNLAMVTDSPLASALEMVENTAVTAETASAFDNVVPAASRETNCVRFIGASPFANDHWCTAMRADLSFPRSSGRIVIGTDLPQRSFAHHSIAVSVSHVQVGRVAAVHGCDPVPTCFLTGNLPVPVVVVAREHVRAVTFSLGSFA